MNSPALRSSNRIGLDFRAEAERFGAPPAPLIDVHSHIVGAAASRLYREAARLYGVSHTVSMTPLEQLEEVRRALGERVSFVAVPNFGGSDPLYDHGPGYHERLRKFARAGAKIAKFWAAPRIFDFAAGDPRNHPLRLDSPLRLDTMDAAAELGMIFMVHVGDPDTWFATKYADSARYLTKEQQYVQLEAVLDRFPVPLVAAHMGGSPENLPFLSRLLERYPRLHLDTSAAKWMIRELSKHPREELAGFFSRWRGRILFGSDIVTSDQHLSEGEKRNETAAKASSEEEAFELYASRYWALRTLFERDYEGESPIADPDLHLVDPARYAPTDAPPLSGKRLPPDLLSEIYSGAAARLLGALA